MHRPRHLSRLALNTVGNIHRRPLSPAYCRHRCCCCCYHCYHCYHRMLHSYKSGRVSAVLPLISTCSNIVFVSLLAKVSTRRSCREALSNPSRSLLLRMRCACFDGRCLLERERRQLRYNLSRGRRGGTCSCPRHLCRCHRGTNSSDNQPPPSILPSIHPSLQSFLRPTQATYVHVKMLGCLSKLDWVH